MMRPLRKTVIKGDSAMKNIFKKTAALVLALCTVCTLWTPTAVSADEGFVFPEYSDSVNLGQPLRSPIALTEFCEIVEYEGQQYVVAPAKGSKFYIFNFTDYLNGRFNEEGNCLYDWADDGIGVPRGLVQDSKGNIFVCGDANHVFRYNISTGKATKILMPAADGCTGLAVDDSDNLYVAGKNKAGGVIYKVNSGSMVASVLYTDSSMISYAGVSWGNDRLYANGQVRSSSDGAIHEFTASGEQTRSIIIPQFGGSYYSSFVGGVVFLGGSSRLDAGMIAVDTTSSDLTRIDIGKGSNVMGVVTNEHNGKAYMVIYGDGTYEYDVETRTLGAQINTAGTRNLRVRNAYFKYGSSEYIITMGPNSAGAYRISGTEESPDLSGLFEGAYSTFSIRSIGPGVAGTGVAVYVGAYLNSYVASYSPDLEKPYNHQVFSNGRAQTDALIVYNGKLYAGCYAGGYLLEYDPATGEKKDLLPGGLSKEYDQVRIHGLAAGDNKVFFSTIPNDQTLGGCIGWVDLTTGEVYCERNVIQDQATITLAYDEERDILYGGTTIRGGTNTKGTAEQAVVYAYDVNAKKLLAQTTVSSLTGDKPRYISGIARDPGNGKLWGLVSQTVFSFTYGNGQITVTEEWEAATAPSDRYSDSASRSWFPRPILFDGDGGMYIGMDQQAYGIMKFTMDASGKITKAITVSDSTSRIYTLGADGNLYICGEELTMVTVNRATMVKDMIDTTRQTDREGIAQIFRAYNALNQSEKDQLKGEYYDKLLQLESTMETLEQEAVDETIAAINSLGVITVTSGSEVAKARMYYDSLSEDGKTKVTNAQKLFDVEAAFASISEKTAWDEEKSQTYQFGKSSNKSIGKTDLSGITYAHITAGNWEFAMSAGGTDMDFNNIDNIRLNLSDNGWLALRIKVDEAGLYDVTLDTKNYKGCLGGVYVFPDTGTDGQWQQVVTAEMGVGAYSDHYVGSVDFSQDGTANVGKWQCDSAGEYILAINCLQVRAGSYASVKSLTITKRDPVADATVEQVKSCIESVGAITEHSDKVLEEARTAYNTLSDQQKQLIYAVVLDEMEAEYQKVMQDKAAAARVQEQINAIGTVTAESGPVIQLARQAFDALTPEQQAQVPNADALIAAEQAYAALTGDDQSGPSDDDGGSSAWIIVLVVVLVLAAAAVAAVLILRKKNKSAEAIHESPAPEQPTPEK